VWQGPSPYDRAYPISEVKTWPKEKWQEWRHYFYQIGDDLWGPKDLNNVDEDDANFLNHSCNPNVWFDGPFRHIALRDIEAGEELTYDYGVENLEDDDFKCLCRQRNCRGVITKNDWKLESVQKFHGEHMAPHVLELVKEQENLKHDQEKRAQSPSSDSENRSLSPSPDSESVIEGPFFRKDVRHDSPKLAPKVD